MFLAPYWEMTVTWAEAEPKSTLMVTGDPADQNVDPGAVIGPSRTKDVSDPAGSSAGATLGRRSNVSGPAAVPRAQVSVPPDVMLHGESHAGGVAPVLVPAKTTSQEGEVPQLMGLPPLFLMLTVMAKGGDDPGPALSEAPTMVTLELDVALLTRLYIDALTTPPTPRTAAMMMKRSML